MKLFSFVLLLAGLAFAQPAQTKIGAIVMGKVQTEQGAPAAGVWVTLVRDAIDPKSPPPPFTTGAPVWPDGSFVLTGLEPGAYHLCAGLPQSTWLNTCQWSTKPTAVKLVAEQIVEGVAMTIRKGVILPIRVEDPAQHISKNTGKAGAHILIGITTDSGMFQPARIAATDAKGQDQEILVPAGTPVNVKVYSKFYKLADDKGKDMPASITNLGTTVAAGRPAPKLKVVVTGVRP